ncbi:MAG TPA: phosphatase PAP2 family protein [Chitinophagaceae bacterium]|nr:phosphatase PAP2 family protein [Chitinophagaceae bacterium]
MNFLATPFWQRIIEWDQSFFYKINRDWTNPVFDRIMPYLREGKLWTPVYIFLLFFVLLNFRKSGWWVLFFISAVALTDMTGNYVFKHGFERLRPCNDSSLAEPVRLLLNNCGAGYSFVSNHAANHFAMAAFIVLTLRHFIHKWVWLAVFWAALIAYAQVYVGVHYPLDVLGGAILGILIGGCIGILFNKRFHFANFGNQAAF